MTRTPLLSKTKTSAARQPELSWQEQKSLRSRHLICESTITCLTQLGYAETTLNRVLEQAGISKGTLQYHYPSKEDLMAATAHYLLQRPLALQSAPAQFRAAGNHQQREVAVRQWLKATWDKMVNTGPYYALLEILIATRTDPILHERISGELESSIVQIDEHFYRQYPHLDENAKTQLQALLCANRCLLRGLLIEAQYGLSSRAQKLVLQRWWDMLTPLLLGQFSPID